MIYLILYFMAVVWLVAWMLYADDYLVHSKAEVIFAPLLLTLNTAQFILEWGYRLYQRRTHPYLYSR